ncbi:uncharacterized protein LOC111259690 [Varroa jacobsoni]|uniref:uncharacterized protein LOC111259690 n=1 Tax=Varroa jacobsoni TaxID=62625 RepID=UPI000BF2E1EA|nr:uncharacterized protein LOC111259690 [Varroa jacobsoni]
MAAIAPTGPLSNPLPQMPRPQLPPFPTQAPLPSAQIQAPPIQTSDRNLDVLSTLPVAQYDSVSMATGSGANWFSSAGGDDAAREIYSSTNLGGGIYDNFGGKGSSLSSGADWRELAHWYREQNWGLDSDWSSRGGHLGGHGYGHSYGKNDHNKHGGCSNKNHKINDIKNGLLKAGATALYVKKIGIAFLVALLAPSIVITVLGPFLIALSLAPLNFQLYGFSPAALSTQQQARQQKFIVPGQQLRSQQIQQSQPLDKYLAIKTPSDGKIKKHSQKKKYKFKLVLN